MTRESEARIVEMLRWHEGLHKARMNGEETLTAKVLREAADLLEDALYERDILEEWLVTSAQTEYAMGIRGTFHYMEDWYWSLEGGTADREDRLEQIRDGVTVSFERRDYIGFEWRTERRPTTSRRSRALLDGEG